MEDVMAVQLRIESAPGPQTDLFVRAALNAGIPGGGAAALAGERAKSRVRFATTRALFEAFPDLFKKVGAEPTDQCPIGFLRSLVSQDKLDAAVAFCAYLLPRR